MCSFLEKDFDSALHYFERALRVNPNLAFVWSLSALTYCYVGEPEIALQRLERHRDLTPIEPYPSLFDNPYAIAYLIKRDYEQAAIFGRRVTKARPEFVNGYKPLIAALGHLGRKEEAKLILPSCYRLNRVLRSSGSVKFILSNTQGSGALHDGPAFSKNHGKSGATARPR